MVNHEVLGTQALKVYPAADGWVVSSQQPPTSERGDRRRVETTVEVLQDSLQKLVVEAKHHDASQDEIQEVEGQAYSGCMKYLKYSGRTAMYAMTAVGTRARLWTVHRNEDYLEPYVPNGFGLAKIAEYIEANSTEGYQIIEGRADEDRSFATSEKDSNPEERRITTTKSHRTSQH
jgi:hypothetical protein